MHDSNGLNLSYAWVSLVTIVQSLGSEWVNLLIMIICLVTRLLQKTDLKIGPIRDILMIAAPRQMGPSWTINRDNDQWKAIENERIYAMSSSCDKKEFNPPTKSISTSLATSLWHLAELHHQLSEENVQNVVNRFEHFIMSIKKEYPSFTEFRDSELFDDFNDESIDYEQNTSTQKKTTTDFEYTEEELAAKRPRLY